MQRASSPADAAAQGEHGLDRFPDLVFAAGVGREGEGAGIVELLLHLLELLRRAPDQGDARAQRAQLMGGAAAEPRAAAGDDDGLAGEQAGTEDGMVLHGAAVRTTEDYSILMSAAFTTAAHFVISARRKAASSSGVEPIASTPRSASLALMSSRRMIMAASACRRCSTRGGVPAGAIRAFHPEISQSFTPASARAGTSGAAGERPDLAAARLRQARRCAGTACTPAGISRIFGIPARHFLPRGLASLHWGFPQFPQFPLAICH